MATCVFIYNSNSVTIQCKENDKMRKVCKDFQNKHNNNRNDIDFYYFGMPINPESTFYETANELDKLNKEITINVYNKNESNDSGPKLEKSKDIIYPICKKNCYIKIEGKYIKTKCSDNHEKKTLLTQFEKTQIIDISAIKCSKCNLSNKKESETCGTFYYCLICKENICHNCKCLHPQKHKLSEYNNKKGLCLKHRDNYTSYCEDCKMDLCDLCESKHDKNHNIKQYKEKAVDVEELSIKHKNIETKTNDIIKKICEKLNFIKALLCFSGERIENYEPRNKNNIELENINEIKKNIEKYGNIEHLFANVLKIINHFKYSDFEKKTIISEEFISKKKKSENLINFNYNELLIKRESFKELKVEKMNIIDDCHYIKNIDNFIYINENIVVKKENKNNELFIYNKNVKNDSLFFLLNSEISNSKLTSIQKLYYTLINYIHLYNNEQSCVYQKYIKQFFFFSYLNQFTSIILIYGIIFTQEYVYKLKYSFFISSKHVNNEIIKFEIAFSKCSNLKYVPVIENKNNNIKNFFSLLNLPMNYNKHNNHNKHSKYNK